ncbi:MAG: DEAD/DEAH box helicase [Verrucomicrobiales bacterium]|nr:DEAD/DEAH box helicase [Verrucomicrobiales bacterium]
MPARSLIERPLCESPPAAVAAFPRTPYPRSSMDETPELHLFDHLGISPNLLQAIKAQGFEQPSPIQQQAIPPALAGRDIVGQSQTGSGKTLAFAIPALQCLDASRTEVQVLILCPTRELAMQVCQEVHKLTSHLHGVQATPIYGGASYDRQIRALRHGTQIVVGTPGRVIDFIERGVLRLDAIRMLVFDEADEMLDMGFRDEIDQVVSLLPEQRQTIFFSATLAGPIKDLIENYTRDPAWITIEHKALTVPTIEQRYYEVNARSKNEVLCRLLDLENPRLAIIFANTKRTVDDITDDLMAQGYSIDRLHGDLNQTMRDRVMRNFRAGNIEILAATDVAARGLDVDDIDLVVNYELPYDEEDYVHRIGRTGRAGREGKAFSLVSGRAIYLLQRIQRYAKVRIERHAVPTREEVAGRRTDAFFEKLRTTLEEGAFDRHDAEIQRLLDAGHTPTDIASALLHLWIGDSSREGTEILEDRPRGGKGSREDRPPRFERERPERFERQGRPDRREDREFDRPRRRFDDEGPPRHRRDDREGDGYRPRREERPQRPFRDAQDRPPRPAPSRGDSGDQARLFLNIGSLSGVTPRQIAGALYHGCQLPQGSVGKIEMRPKGTIIHLDRNQVEAAQRGMATTRIAGRSLRLEPAMGES